MTTIIVLGVIVFLLNVFVLWCAWAIPGDECGDD